MAKYNFLRFLSSMKAIVEKDSQLFVASFSDRVHPPEVMVFKCDANGNVDNWMDVDGGRGYHSLQEFLDLYTTPAIISTE